MTAKCPMDLDAQKLNSAYPRGHFDTYLTYMAQSARSYSTETRPQMHTKSSKIQNICSFLRIGLYGKYQYEHFTIYQAIDDKSDKTPIPPFASFKKITIDLLSLGIYSMLWDPTFDLPNQVLKKVRICTPFWVPDP